MLTEKEIAFWSNERPDERYAYTIKQVAASGTVWVIADQYGFRTYPDDADNFLFPIWPSGEFAQLCCVGEYADCEPGEMDLEEFMNDYLPHFKAQQHRLVVFPVADEIAPVREIDEFLKDLKGS